MVKLLLVVCVVVSIIFLITQTTTVYFFDNLEDKDIHVRFKGPQQKFRKIIQLLQDVCKSRRINCILIDLELLQRFLSREISHRKSGVHDHVACKLLCGQTAATFMLKGSELHLNFHIFKDSLEIHGFSVKVDEDFDQRDASLERQHGKHKLIYHLFVEKDDMFIHLLVAYNRHNHDWSHKCNLHLIRGTKWISYLKSSIYCQENILRKMDATSAMVDGFQILVPQYIQTFINDAKHSKYIPCNYENARKYVSKYGYDATDEDTDFRIKATQILTIVVDVLSRLGVRFWLSSGTCLGWYRQCDFITHSKDVDIGIWIKDYNPSIIEEFKSRGLNLKHLFGKLTDSFELSFAINDLKLDIFFFYEDAQYMWNGGTQVKTGKKFKYLFPKFTLCWTTINELIVRVPCDTHEYILANYGEKWNELVKTWDWKASPPNVRENGEWANSERKQVIQMF